MTEFNNPAAKTAATTIAISESDFLGANSGQRPDLLNRPQTIYRVNGRLVEPNPQMTQLVPVRDLLRVDAKERLKTAIASAFTGNAVKSRAYCAAPSWQPNFAYIFGNTVRGIGVGNTQNVYLCVGAGTSAASGGPTVAEAAGIFDNTCGWLFIGQGNATESIPLYSTLVPSVPSSVMDGYTTVVTPAVANAIGLTRNFDNVFSAPAFQITGGPLIDDGGRITIRGPNVGTLTAPAYNQSSARWMVSFATDAQKWVYIQPTSHARQIFHIEVNGRPLTEGNYCAAAQVASGGLLLDVSKFGPGVKEIRLYDVNTIREVVFRVVVQATENVWPLKPRSSLKGAFEGDSIKVGSGTASSLVPTFLEATICKLLGVEQWYLNGVGATGAIANGSPPGTATTYLQRLPDIVSENPDFLMISGFHNDASRTQTEKRTAFLTYLREVRRLLPSCFIILVGTQTLKNGNLNTGGTSSLFDVEQDAKWAFDQLNDDNAMFIRTVTRQYPFPGSTQNGWFFQSDQAAPFNDSHPTPRYNDVYAHFVVNEIRAYLMGEA